MTRTALCALIGALLGLMVLTAPGPAWAQDDGERSVATLIEQGQAAFDEQNYEESIQALSAALVRPDIAKDEKIKVYQLLAYNYIVLNREQPGENAVFGLLAQDPDYRLPDTESPRFRDFFEVARQKWEKAGRPGWKDPSKEVATTRVKIVHTAPAQVEADLAVLLEGSIEDPEASVSKLTLYYRTGSSGDFSTAKVKYAMRKFTAEIPGDAVEPPIVEYYIAAVDKNGTTITTRGDAANPLRIAVPESGGSVFTSPWFWIPVGVAVAAAIIIPIVVVSTTTSESTVRVNVFEN